MSDDLISRKAVQDLISSKLTDGHLQFGEDTPLIDAAELMDDVSDLHTAYDADKVIEKLEKESDHYECEEQGREDVYMVDLEKAVEIVKAGGKE